MAVAAGTVTAGALNNGSTTTTISFVSTSDPLYCRVGWWGSGNSISSVTYGGTALTRVAQSGNSSGQDECEIWRLLSPAAGTANLVITFSTSVSAGRAVICNVTGQDAGTPEGTPKTAVSAGNGTGTGSQTITGAAAGDLTIVVVANGNGAAITPSATGGGAASEESDAASNGEGMECFKAADATTAVSASWSGATSWAIAAIPLKAAAAASGPTVPEFQGSVPEEWVEADDAFDTNEARQEWNPNLLGSPADPDPALLSETAARADVEPDLSEYEREDERGGWSANDITLAETLVEVLVAEAAARADVEPAPEWEREDERGDWGAPLVPEQSDPTGVIASVAALADVEPAEEWEPEDERGTWNPNLDTAPTAPDPALLGALAAAADVEPHDEDREIEDERGGWGANDITLAATLPEVVAAEVARLAEVEPAPEWGPDDERGDWNAGLIELVSDTTAVIAALAALGEVEPDLSDYEREDERGTWTALYVSTPLTDVAVLVNSVREILDDPAESPEPDVVAAFFPIIQSVYSALVARGGPIVAVAGPLVQPPAVGTIPTSDKPPPPAVRRNYP